MTLINRPGLVGKLNAESTEMPVVPFQKEPSSLSDAIKAVTAAEAAKPYNWKPSDNNPFPDELQYALERMPPEVSIRYFGPSKEDPAVPSVDITPSLAVNRLMQVQEDTWKTIELPETPEARENYLDSVIRKASEVKWPKFQFDRPLLPTDVLPLLDFPKLPEGGFKRGEMIAFATRHPGYLSEPKSNIAMHMLIRQALERPGSTIVMNMEHDANIGRGMERVAFDIEPGITIDSMDQYNKERAEGKIPSMIKGSETRTAQPKHHKAKKGGGKKRVAVSPLLKKLMKGISK